MKIINAIASKSDAHRALICAALSEKRCNVIFNTTSQDIEATISCLEAMKAGRKEMYCKESGSTFRFLLPIMGALGYAADFYPEGRLPDRPLSLLYEEMIKKGCSLSRQGEVPFKVRGRLVSGVYTIAGNVSSQYISGLLFALPLLANDSSITIEGELQSIDYIHMTLNTLSQFGIEIEQKTNGFFISGNQKYMGPETYEVEGDWSNAAFWLIAGAFLEDGIGIKGLNPDSVQGDKKITEVIRQFGAKVEFKENLLCVSKGNLKGIKIDAGQIPDMIPAVAVLAAGATGKTEIVNAGRLRHKESDRLHSITEVIRNLGGKVDEFDDGLIIYGTEGLKGGKVQSFGDHRIAMMSAIASIICKEKVEITGTEAVNKSYPDFFKDLQKLQLDQNIERV